MRQALALCTALVFALGLVGVALAQGTQQPSSGSAPAAPSPSPASPGTGGSTTDTTKSTAPSGKTDMGKPDATKTDKSAAGKPADKMAGGSRGQHKMTGEVTKIDATKGMVSLKTDEGDLDLHFPPSALQGIKEGDRVEIQLAIRPAAAAGKPAAGKAPATKTDDMTKGSGKAPASTGAPQQPKTQ
jgi:hypothetical protein